MYLICVHVNSKYNKESKPYFLHALTRLFFVAYFSKNLSPCCSPSIYFQYSIQIMNPHQAFTSSFGGQKSTNKLNLLLPPEISKGLLWPLDIQQRLTVILCPMRDTYLFVCVMLIMIGFVIVNTAKVFSSYSSSFGKCGTVSQSR